MDNYSTKSEVPGFIIRPTNQEKFRANVGRRIIEEVLTENLSGLTYESNDIEELSKSLALKIRCRLKELDLPRYKYIVQVILGEERGQGARASGGCIWDNDSDSVAYHTYSHEQLFCEATVFAVFHY